jgi:hypothetical protein
LVELIDLELVDQTQLMEEAGRAPRFLKTHARADKINVGALGYVVRQLHLHIVARVVGEQTWPGLMWGHGAATPYENTAAQALIATGRDGLPVQLMTSDVLEIIYTNILCIRSIDSLIAPQPIEIIENGLANGSSADRTIA